MQSWVGWFVVIATVAILLQMLVLLLLFLELRRTGAALLRIVADFEARMSPILTRVGRLLEDSQGRLTGLLADTSEIMSLARQQAQRFDRVLGEATDRLRLQVIRADQIVSGTLDTVEDVGGKFQKAVVGPVQSAVALVEGIKSGIEFFRGHRRAPERAREAQDESLFI